MRREDPTHSCLKPEPGRGQWEKQDLKTCNLCKPIEGSVSSLLRKQFRFRVVRIADRRFRNTTEKKLIGQLASCPDCAASPEWLGRFAYSEKIRSSGMWNSQHVNPRSGMTPEEWSGFERAVEDTAGFFDEDDELALFGFEFFLD